MKRHAPATARNREPIVTVLRRVLPERGKVLEIASGTGEHAAYFAERLGGLRWQPSEVDELALASIDAHRGDAGCDNLLGPVRIDVCDPQWGEAARGADAVVCINLIHIAPWACCAALLNGAARILAAGAPLVLYGPFRIGGSFTAPSNATFDAALRYQNAAWGVRDLEDVTDLATCKGFWREQVIDMPANNHTVVFRRGGLLPDTSRPPR